MLGWRRWWGVDGRTLIETSSVGKSPGVLVLHLAVDVDSVESPLPLSHHGLSNRGPEQLADLPTVGDILEIFLSQQK